MRLCWCAIVGGARKIFSNHSNAIGRKIWKFFFQQHFPFSVLCQTRKINFLQCELNHALTFLSCWAKYKIKFQFFNPFELPTIFCLSSSISRVEEKITIKLSYLQRGTKIFMLSTWLVVSSWNISKISSWENLPSFPHSLFKWADDENPFNHENHSTFVD